MVGLASERVGFYNKAVGAISEVNQSKTNFVLEVALTAQEDMNPHSASFSSSHPQTTV